jgi:hypothetical protein
MLSFAQHRGFFSALLFIAPFDEREFFARGVAIEPIRGGLVAKLEISLNLRRKKKQKGEARCAPPISNSYARIRLYSNSYSAAVFWSALI